MTVASMLSDLLPTRLLRTIAVSTWPAATVAAALPHFLSPLLPATTEAEIVLSQIALFLLITTIGSTSALVLLLCHTSGLSKRIEFGPKMADHHKVMVAISRVTKPTVKKVAMATGLAEETVTRHIEMLRKHNYIESTNGIALTEEGHRAVLQF